MYQGNFLQNIKGEWMETINLSTAQISNGGGVTIRDTATNSLQVNH